MKINEINIDFRPLEKNIGRYTYLLEALDSEGKIITDTIMIHVQQAREARNYNHRFTATFKLEKKYEYDFVYSLDWQVRQFYIFYACFWSIFY